MSNYSIIKIESGKEGAPSLEIGIDRRKLLFTELIIKT